MSVIDIYGTVESHDLKKAMRELSYNSELTRGEKIVYHAQVNPAPGEDRKMGREDWISCADILGKELKLDGQKRFLVIHEKHGRTHCHAVWDRFDMESNRLISDKMSFKAHDRARHIMEKELGHSLTPVKSPKAPELKEVMTGLWLGSTTPQDFVDQSRKAGFEVVRSDNRRPFMVVDKDGRSFDLVRQLKGVKTKDVGERLKGVELLTDREAIRAIRNRQVTDKLMVFKENIRPDRKKQFSEKMKQLLERDKSKDNDLEI